MIEIADIDRLTAQIAFASLRGITQTLAGEILARIGDEESFFQATERQLGSIMGFSNKLFDREYRNKLLDTARREANFIAANSVRPVYYTDPDYPTRLSDCPDSPLMLFTAGECDLNSCLTIGIVGTRHATPYGISFTEKLVEELAERTDGNIAVISGLAFGIDIAAHRAALKAGVPTVAVLAHGLNTIYPAAHRSTAARIAKGGGALVTDYRSVDTVTKHNFLARNRIVAGLSDCLLVAESAEKGGAMVTARIAADYGRDVFALPGRVNDRYSTGCNRLIARNVAALATSADDIIDAMRWPRKTVDATQQSLFPELSDEETAVMELLHNSGEAHINSMTIALDISIGRLTALLIEMEFKGLVKPFPGGKYRPATI